MAMVFLLVRVDDLVTSQVGFLQETHVANVTFERLFPAMLGLVRVEVQPPQKSLPTLLAMEAILKTIQGGWFAFSSVFNCSCLKDKYPFWTIKMFSMLNKLYTFVTTAYW
jgi:hypothetical protein